MSNVKTFIKLSLMYIIVNGISTGCLAENQLLYPTVLSTSGYGIGSRIIAELNVMFPSFHNQNNLGIFDIKFKKDNKRSSEWNLGLIYRYNFFDKIIFGLYGYLDSRQTVNKLLATQLTTGLEILSTNFDLRFNLYIPHNKKKILSSENKIFIRNHTKL